MRPAVGVFPSRERAAEAISDLRRAGFPEDRLNLLFPWASEERIHSIPASDTEQPGVGAAIGGVVGAALGMAGGFELGTAVASALPGVGPVVAAGIAGAALLGAGGLLGGVRVGSKADQDTTEGLPEDELFFYEDALRQGRSVVIVLAEDAASHKEARAVLARAGAETLDAAREDWWIGLRDVEAEHYRSLGHDFEADQREYRAGFEAALRPDCGPSNGNDLQSRFSEQWQSQAFREGFTRGRDYRNRR